MPSDPTEPGTYQSLYRRFRPQRFYEVLGQDHVAMALRNAVREGRIGHAYLFSGPRGTGKTSTARILGKALNCTELVDGEPCGRCDSCRAVAAGASFDVHELDAASNNGVDAMRDLVARAALATPGRWKVYIVDEVHMLSTAASNALLKTLEEPPDHVVFVLATTEPQKVLPTIRSRTQHFEFHLLPDEVLGHLLEQVARDAGLQLPEGALPQSVRRARGSARDALSMLDQVAASGVVEADGDRWLGAVVDALVAYDQAAVLTSVESAIQDGRDPQQLALDLIDRLRVGFLAMVGSESQAASGVAEDELEGLKGLGRGRVVRAMETIGLAVVAMREAPDPRVTLEVALIRLARPEEETSVEALIERIERLERQLAEGGAAPQPAPAPPRSRSATPAPPARPAARPAAPPRPPTGMSAASDAPAAQEVPSRAPASSARPSLGAYLQGAAPTPSLDAEPAPEDAPTAMAPVVPLAGAPSRDELVAAWGDSVIVGLRPKVRAIFQAGRFVAVDQGMPLFAVPNEAHLLHAEPLRLEVDEALSRHFGRRISIRLITEAAANSFGAARAPQFDPDAVEEIEEGPARPPTRVEQTRKELEEALPEVDLDDVGSPIEEYDGPEPAGATSLAEDRILQAFPGAEEV